MSGRHDALIAIGVRRADDVRGRAVWSDHDSVAAPDAMIQTSAPNRMTTLNLAL